MNLRKLVWRELFERKSQMITITIGILLGITTVIAIKNITYFSEKAIARELDSLGANVLILPKSVSLQDYYAADMHHEVKRIYFAASRWLDWITPPSRSRAATLSRSSGPAAAARAHFC